MSAMLMIGTVGILAAPVIQTVLPSKAAPMRSLLRLRAPHSGPSEAEHRSGPGVCQGEGGVVVYTGTRQQVHFADIVAALGAGP